VEDLSPAVSVVHDTGGYAVVSQAPAFGTDVLLRRGAAPEGPFGEPETIATVSAPPGAPGAYAYGARLHPELAADGRQLLSYDVNGGDIMADASLYRPRFVALDWPTGG
jgi:hypothetical protein